MIMSVSDLYKRLRVSFDAEIGFTAGKNSVRTAVLRMLLVSDTASAEKIQMYDAVVFYSAAGGGMTAYETAKRLAGIGAGVMMICSAYFDAGELTGLRRLCDSLSLPLIELGSSELFPLLIYRTSEEINSFYAVERNFEKALQCVILSSEQYDLYRHLLICNGFFDSSRYCAAVYLFVPKTNGAVRQAEIVSAARSIEMGITSKLYASVFEIGTEVAVIIPDSSPEKSSEAFKSGIDYIPGAIKKKYDVFVGVSHEADGISKLSCLLRYAEKSAVLQRERGKTDYDIMSAGGGLDRFIIWLSESGETDPDVTDTVKKIAEYDRVKKTCYLKLLKTYFRNNCSLLKTSEEMYLHKNSVCNSLRKIEGLIGREISDVRTRAELLIIIGLSELRETEENRDNPIESR